jgi:stearoyl-CoA desaturase (delta-9 desaturase)
MAYPLICLVVFLTAYLVNVLYITVFYHRGLTHGAVRLSPGTRRWVALTGNWLTGLDPKGWSCMHRMHHLYSDTPNDPHSPVYQGVFGLALGQLHSYEKTLVCLNRGVEPYTSLVRDLDFEVNWLNRHKLWYLPYLLHVAIALAIGLGTGLWLLGYCYFAGIMSHPIQGWMVNSLGHRFGYRTYNTPDNARNNTIVAWLVAGEGYQNNHHYRPSSAKFSVQWYEVDFGWTLCHIAEWLGWITIVRPDEPLPDAVAQPA